MARAKGQPWKDIVAARVCVYSCDFFRSRMRIRYGFYSINDCRPGAYVAPWRLRFVVEEAYRCTITNIRVRRKSSSFRKYYRGWHGGVGR